MVKILEGLFASVVGSGWMSSLETAEAPGLEYDRRVPGGCEQMRNYLRNSKTL
jgi:hypothetical protein